MRARLYEFQSKVDNNDDLKSYEDFIDFSRAYLDFIGAGRTSHPNIQAEIIATRNENYHFFQYKDDGGYCITRPVNINLFISADQFDKASVVFKESLKDPRLIADDKSARENINRVIYTCQQCVGCTLDAFNNPNKARKRNGLLFEVLVRSVINAAGITCESYDEVITIDDNESMKFQHDLVIKGADDSVGGIGQLKTSSKDRIDKIFLDKYMYEKQTGSEIPHFAIFLNDVQRASQKDGQYSINSTFLPGHFKAYTMALTPLDGVYYFDMLQNMEKDPVLAAQIFKFDKFLVEDMWKMIER